MDEDLRIPPSHEKKKVTAITQESVNYSGLTELTSLRVRVRSHSRSEPADVAFPRLFP